MIFLNIGWMEKYKGLKNDSIRYGGSSAKKYEIYNYLPYEGYMYGYVSAVHATIDLNRLGALPNDNSIDNILAIWTAKSDDRGTVIIGWYDNATIYRKERLDNKIDNRENCPYQVKAQEKDCKLYDIDERVFKPIGRGRSHVWFAALDKHKQLRKEVLDYVDKNQIPKRSRPSKRLWQTNPYKRNVIEKKAIKITTEYYEKLNYLVNSVEKDNVGWDLDATLYGIKLKLEVKGLSGEKILIELTPKEYKSMKKYKNDYRICVVTKASEKQPMLKVFSYSKKTGNWEDKDGTKMIINEKIGARINT